MDDSIGADKIRIAMSGDMAILSGTVRSLAKKDNVELAV